MNPSGIFPARGPLGFPQRQTPEQTPNEITVRPPIPGKTNAFKITLAVGQSEILLGENPNRISAVIYPDNNAIWVGEDATDATAFKLGVGVAITITHGRVFRGYSAAGSDVYVYEELRERC